MSETLELHPLLRESGSSSFISSAEPGSESPDGEEGNTVISACIIGDRDSLVYLLERGADPNWCDSKGRAGVHWAAIRGRDDFIQVLIEYGANVNQADCNGNAPLHYGGHLDTVRCLLEYGADTKIRNRVGDLPEALMKRRGVDPAIIGLVSHAQSDESQSDESLQPLIRRNSKARRTVRRRRGICSMRNVWFEFCTDLGAERLAVIIIVALILSLYVAYLATQLAKQIDTRIPVAEQRNIEL